MDSGFKQKWNSLRRVWLLVLVLLILVAASAVLVGALMKDYAGGEKNLIALYPGDRIDTNKGLITEWVEGERHPDFESGGEGGSWEGSASVDLFKDVYTNAAGDVIIESANGDKVVAPGASNTYDFTMKNTGNISLDYSITLVTDFALEGITLPFQLRLRNGEEWIVGGDESWEPAAELASVTLKGRLESGKYTTYTLEWRWPYETSADDERLLADLNDTLIGDSAVSADVDFSLDIGIRSQITPGAFAVDKDGNPLLTTTKVEPEVIYIGTGLVVFAVSAFLLVILLVMRGRVYVTGFLPEGGIVLYRRSRALYTAPDGRFSLGRIFCRSLRFSMRGPFGDDIPVDDVILRRTHSLRGLAFRRTRGGTIVKVGGGIKAIELYFVMSGGRLVLDTAMYAAIDSRHYVYTECDVTPPDEDGGNATPGRLCIDGAGHISSR